jgi:hypothetical protein
MTLGLEVRCSVQLSYEGKVPRGGLEPPRSHEQRILSPVCLPIPPPRHSTPGRNRTCDLQIKSLLLSRLSYGGIVYILFYSFCNVKWFSSMLLIFIDKLYIGVPFVLCSKISFVSSLSNTSNGVSGGYSFITSNSNSSNPYSL